MQWHAAVAALVLSAGVSACGGPPVPVASGSGDAALRDALSKYVVEFLRRNPTTSTYLGGEGLDASLRDADGTLRDHSRAAIEAEDRWLSITARGLGELDDATLTDGARTDRAVALAQIRFMLHQHQVRRHQERALDTYVSEPFRAVDWQLQGLTQTGADTTGSPAEWRRVIGRVRAIPAFLGVAQAQLEAGLQTGNVPDRRMLERDGLDTSEANARYFRETLPAVAAQRLAGGDRDALMADLRSAGADASAAYLRFRDFITAAFFDGAHTVKPRFAADRFALGEAEYDWALRNNFRLEVSAATLFDEAWPVVQGTQRQMIELATQIGTRHGWPLPAGGPDAVRAVFDKLSADHPRTDAEMVAWYRAAALRLVDYGRKTRLFDVPADYRLDVVETPLPLQASIDGAAYYPAPPFKGSGVGRFYVTPTHDDAAALRTNNRAALAYLAAHEGFPGHDWYFKVLTEARDAASPVRWLTPGAVEDSSSMWEDSLSSEGWGLYAEALMAEPQTDAPGGFYSPEERLYQLQGKLYRDLRVLIDTGIHTGRMGYDQATTMYSEVVDFVPGPCDAPGRRTSEAKRASCEGAERAVFRYSKWPTQAITYRIGMDQIRALREEAARRLGDRFSPQAFHLAFIRQGTIPSGYFADILLRQLAAGN